MSEQDDRWIELRHDLPSSAGSAPEVLDEDTVDRLLAGRLDPTDAPPGYSGVVRLLAAATAPAGRDELVGEAEAVAAFRAAMRPRPSTAVSRRAAVPTRFGFKAAMVAVVAVLLLGGAAAAATRLLPATAQRTAGRTPATTAGAAPATHGQGGAAVPVITRDTQPARKALCIAYLAGQGGQNGRRVDAPAFQALARAAGGVDKIAAYCQDLPSTSTGASRQDRAATTAPDASGMAKAGLCRAYLTGQGDQNGQRAPAFQALVRAAGGVGKVAAYCRGTQASGQGSHGHAQGRPPTTIDRGRGHG